jgi:hypothetical protein
MMQLVYHRNPAPNAVIADIYARLHRLQLLDEKIDMIGCCHEFLALLLPREILAQHGITAQEKLSFEKALTKPNFSMTLLIWRRCALILRTFPGKFLG